MFINGQLVVLSSHLLSAVASEDIMKLYEASLRKRHFIVCNKTQTGGDIVYLFVCFVRFASDEKHLTVLRCL